MKIRRYGNKLQATPEQVQQVIELSKEYIVREISEITGLTRGVVANIQVREKVKNPKKKFRTVKPKSEVKEGFFDIDEYARNYIY